jgi:aspartate racemase
MKTIGLIGGMSWESSLEYYRIINEQVKARLGGLHSADSLMYSFDFARIEELQHQGRWDELTNMMVEAAQRLERGGADFIVICTNTMHKMADNVEQAVDIPLLHIADGTARRIQMLRLRKVGLLGTKFTMEQDFYRGRLVEKFGLEILIPDGAERQVVHDVIYNELVLGKIDPVSKAKYQQIMANLVSEGAEGIILGCTEIGLLVEQSDSMVPLFDTAVIHAEEAVEIALADELETS